MSIANNDMQPSWKIGILLSQQQSLGYSGRSAVGRDQHGVTARVSDGIAAFIKSSSARLTELKNRMILEKSVRYIGVTRPVVTHRSDWHI